MRSRTKNIFKILTVFIILLAIIINFGIIASSLRIEIADYTAPLLDSLGAGLSPIKKMIPFFSLREENRLLRERIDLLRRKIEEMKIIEDENRIFRNLLNFKEAIPYATVPAEVIGRDPSNWSNSLIINKGSKDGIRPNKAVLSTKGLVGRTVEVGQRSSRILLISDPNSKVGVFIRRNRQGGILIGRPDGMCKMVYIALDSDASRGDKVATAGFGKIFPKGILIGDIVAVDKEPGRLYKYAIVKIAQDLSMLEEVLCIK